MIDGLKQLGALGMKVPEQYGGLGLSQVYYNRALALAASSHAAISTMLSAHQSIGVAEPLLLFGSEERKWFVLPYDSDGITVEHRNAFMGLRGIENSVTRVENVFVPRENVIAKEGQGLKIALTTLNTGRLALPAICVGSAKWATRVAREWSSERVQWGQAIGKHDAVAQKLAFIAASTFGLEAVVDVSSRLADDKKNDIRIEAAIAKLYASELGWHVVDELVQIRGGRGYETAESLLARGEEPIPRRAGAARYANQSHLRGIE